MHRLTLRSTRTRQKRRAGELLRYMQLISKQMEAP